MKSRFLRAALGRAAFHTALLSISSGAAMAASVYWEGGTTAATQSWSTAGNWSDTPEGDGSTLGTVPGATDDAVFNAVSIAEERTVNLGANRSIRSLTFTSAFPVTLLSGSGSAFRMTIGSGGITVNPAAGAITLGSGNTSNGVPLTLGGSQTWTNNSGGSLITRNTMTGASGVPLTLTVDGSGNTNIVNTLSDGSSAGVITIVKNGSGVLELGSSNSYSGGTTINGGVIAVGTNARLGTTTGAITFGGGTLRATASFTSGRATMINAGGAAYEVLADLTLTQTAPISGGGNLAKIGPGTLVLSGAQTYTGTTTVSGGVIQFNSPAAIYNGNVSAWTTSNLIMAGDGIIAAGTGGTDQFTSADIATLLASNAFSAGGHFGISTASGSFTYDGVLADAAGGILSFHKIGANTLTLGGSAPNTHTGPTTVTGGTLSLGKTGGANAIGGNILITEGNLSWAGDNQVADTADITVSNTAALNNRTETIRNLNVNGGGFTTGTGSLTADSITLATVGATRSLLTINGAGTVSTRSLVLAGAPNPNGGATGSNLLIGGANGTTLAVGSGGITMSGQNIQINRPTSIIEGTAPQIILQGDFTASGTNNIVYGNTSLVANGIFNLDAGSRTFDITGGITTVRVRIMNGGITKSGAGTLILADSANGYTGTTLVAAGKLLINSQQSLANGAVDVAVGAILGGSGTVGGATTVAGIHAPGDEAAGMQGFENGLTYAPGSTFSWQLNGETTTEPGTSFDKVSVWSGPLNIGTGVKFDVVVGGLNLNSPFWASDQTWDVFDVNSTAGNFSTFALYDAANPGTPINYSGYGQFSFNAATGELKWTAAPGGFSTWIGGFPGLSDTSAKGDPDADGLSNLIEYALGLHPGTADSSGAVRFSQSASGISVTYRVSTAATGVTLVPEWSVTLGGSADWSRSGIIIETLGSTPEYTEMRATLAIDPADPKRFLRLHAATE